MYKFLTFLGCFLLLINHSFAQVNPTLGEIETTVYMSPNGDDNNTGTIDSPLATFQEALFYCPYGTNGGNAYSEIVLLAGNYTITEEMRQACWQYQNDNGFKNVSLRGTHRDSVILDGSTAIDFAGKFINLIGSGISIKDLTIKLASETDTSSHYAVLDVKSLASPCNTVPTSNILIENILIDGCWDHGINVTESDSILIRNVEVRNANLINLNGRNEPGGWGSGIKTRLVNHLEINNVRVSNCWGEGISNARTTETFVHHNEISDNYSVNIYLDNVIGGTYSHNLTYGTIGDNTYWRNSQPSSGFGIATEHYSGINFDETSNIRIYNNIILNTQGLYIDDNRTSTEPLGTTFKNIWFCNNSIIGWQGDLNTNLRAIRFDYAGYNNGDISLDSIYLFNNIIALDTNFVSSNGNGQLISGTGEALPPTLFYGYNYWAASPEKFSFFNYTHDSNTDSINFNIPTIASPNLLELIEPNDDNFLIYEGAEFSFIQDDYYGEARMNDYQVGAILSNVKTSDLGDEMQFPPKIQLSPNPTTGIFNLKGLQSNYTIKLMDLNGTIHQIINSRTSSTNIDISTMPNGMYFVLFFNNFNKTIHVKKILKI